MTNTASWRLENNTDEITVFARQINSDHIRLLVMCTPSPEDLINDFSSRLAARAGLSRYQAEKYASEAMILSRFPKLTALFLQGHYPPRVVSKVLDDICIVPDKLCATVDEELITALGPTIANQHVLSPSNASRRILKILEEHCPDLLPPPPPDPKELEVNKGTDGTAQYRLKVNKQDHAAVQKLIKATTDKHNCTQAEALIMLILGKADVSVTLNLYKDMSSIKRELFAEGGWLQGIVAEEWLDRVTHVRTIGPSSTKAYSPTDAQRAFVAGRDGHCRFPGCEAPPQVCDIDHIQRFEGGGKTTTDNLHLLCRRHHRLKTAGSWDVTRHPDSSEVWTSHGDGHTVTTSPSGPLARTSFKQQLSRKVSARKRKNPDTQKS